VEGQSPSGSSSRKSKRERKIQNRNQHENEVLRSNTKRLGEETNSDFSIENPT
jgi:hypothetical protein